MSWMTWVALVLAWPLVGLGMAYLFGRVTHAAETPAGELGSPVLSYLRRVKRASPRAATETKVRREAAGARRAH
jgi:hypothetical protein